MKPLILIDENIPLLAEALAPAIQGKAKILPFSGRNMPRDKMERCEALIVRSITRVDEELLANSPVVFVGTATSGYEHIDTEYLRQKNIRFVDAPGCNANSVAEYVVYSMLLWARVREITLSGQTIGIVGFGHIGKIIAAYAAKLGLEVLVSDPPLSDRHYHFPNSVRVVPLLELLQRANVITNHVPFHRNGNHPTVGLFGAEEIAAVQPGSLFIHTSRRFIASEAALLEGIEQKGLFTAIDVWENEPQVNKILAERCLLATPHIAGYSFEGKINGAKIMAEQFGEFFGYEPDLEVFTRAFAREQEITVRWDDHEELFELLRDSRRLHEDTDMLLETLSTPEHQHSILFDKLRKTYPKRREILGV